MNNTPIPQPIAEAVVTMLRPYAPDLTVEKLEAAISSKPEQEQPEKLLTRKEAAQLLNISIPTIDRMLRDGELSFRKIRRAVRIPLSTIRLLVNHSNT